MTLKDIEIHIERGGILVEQSRDGKVTEYRKHDVIWHGNGWSDFLELIAFRSASGEWLYCLQSPAPWETSDPFATAEPCWKGGR